MTTQRRYPYIFLSLFLNIFVVFLASCDSRHAANDDGVSNNGKYTSNIANESDVISQSKVFLHILLGSDAVNYYKESPPEVTYRPHKKRWDVFFGYLAGGFNMELNADASKGNYRFMNGMIIKRDPSVEYEVTNIPLYSITEMIELLQLEHNKMNPRANQ